jgi:hypothetical protein
MLFIIIIICIPSNHAFVVYFSMANVNAACGADDSVGYYHHSLTTLYIMYKTRVIDMWNDYAVH